MSGNSTKIVARLLWAVPAVLLFMSVYQTKVAFDVHHTLLDGEHAVAEVVDYEKIDRADITYGYVSIRVPMADGEVIEQDKMSLPFTLLKEIEGQQTLDVRVLKNAAQTIVIESVAATHWKIAAMQAAIALGATLLFGWGIYWWNGYLDKFGDPALATGSE